MDCHPCADGSIPPNQRESDCPETSPRDNHKPQLHSDIRAATLYTTASPATPASLPSMDDHSRSIQHSEKSQSTSGARADVAWRDTRSDRVLSNHSSAGLPGSAREACRP